MKTPEDAHKGHSEEEGIVNRGAVKRYRRTDEDDDDDEKLRFAMDEDEE